MRTEDAIIRGIVPTALAAACDSELSFTTGGDAEWFAQSAEYYADNDAAQSGTIGSGQETWMQTTVVGPGNVSFYYKMSSVSGDGLAFYVDENFKASWSQGSNWPWTGNFAVPSGTHTLKWKYYKYSGSTAGSCWIDAIQWSGGAPGSGGGADWEQITYTYDPSGRRIAKDVDGVVTKYLYDGDQCIAEYDGSNNLLRKYVYGPGIDEPICMIEAAGGYAGTYYYHFDALGSVVALSDADGDTVQVYEYDVYGQVAASDPNHPNRFMFTGREFDKETGLYYYRARYYNPTIGRFLQTDPIGYGDGMNWYAYCANNVPNSIDPSGCEQYVNGPQNPCPICGGERSDHYGGVYLDPPPRRPWDLNDFWGSFMGVQYWEYYEWTGGYRITNWRQGLAGISAQGRVRWGRTTIKMSGFVNDVVTLAESVATGTTAGGLAGLAVTTAYGIVWGAVEDKIMEKMETLDAEVQGEHALRAYIEVYVYRRPSNWWEDVCTIGEWMREKRWVEVKCGEGYNTLGLGAYWTRQQAMDAIGIAVQSLPVRENVARR